VAASHASQLPVGATFAEILTLVEPVPAHAVGESPRPRPAALADHLVLRGVLLRL
jgi:hypothetical protein